MAGDTFFRDGTIGFWTGTATDVESVIDALQDLIEKLTGERGRVRVSIQRPGHDGSASTAEEVRNRIQALPEPKDISTIRIHVAVPIEDEDELRVSVRLSRSARSEWDLSSPDESVADLLGPAIEKLFKPGRRWLRIDALEIAPVLGVVFVVVTVVLLGGWALDQNVGIYMLVLVGLPMLVSGVLVAGIAWCVPRLEVRRDGDRTRWQRVGKIVMGGLGAVTVAVIAGLILGWFGS